MERYKNGRKVVKTDQRYEVENKRFAEKVKTFPLTTLQADTIITATIVAAEYKIKKCPHCKRCGHFARWKSGNEYYDFCDGPICTNLGDETKGTVDRSGKIVSSSWRFAAKMKRLKLDITKVKRDSNGQVISVSEDLLSELSELSDMENELSESI